MLYRCFLLVALLLAPHLAHAARIVVFGDSLSAAYGLRPEQGWVRLLQQQLGSTHQVVNSSLSGETTAGGLARLPAVLRQQRPDVLILELGGNDGLRGLPLAAMQDNLSAMVRLAQRAGARVLLIGMALPPNYGPDYGAKFRQVYDKVARRHKVPLVPLLVAGFEQDLALFQGDGIHPVAEAQPRMVRNVLPALTPLIARK
ncbi:arylesterase [Vogesella alkaliphila]|uniref:Arylesterase n=1 Tax=Vogesella alkaliphila TaxID=1193621 RepID=A0ABQ2YY54_9NEIS|nr:arylesterase [Vogesella alkaliphila]GGX95797.1 arylesterase [Vogesella alkaliphila]